MKVLLKPLLFSLLLIVFGPSAYAQAQALTGDIEDAERRWDDVTARGDKDRYRQLLAEEFRWTYVTGEVIDKEEAITRLNPYTLEQVSKQFLKYRDSAVVYGTARLNFQGRPLNERWVRFWARNREGQWQAVYFQATEIQ